MQCYIFVCRFPRITIDLCVWLNIMFNLNIAGFYKAINDHKMLKDGFFMKSKVRFQLDLKKSIAYAGLCYKTTTQHNILFLTSNVIFEKLQQTVK